MTFLSNNMGISIGIMKEQWKQCCQLHMYNSGFHFFNFVISKFQQNFPTNFSLQKISQLPCPKKKPRKNQKKKKKTKIVKPKIWVYIENRFKCVCVCVWARSCVGFSYAGVGFIYTAISYPFWSLGLANSELGYDKELNPNHESFQFAETYQS